jgi:3-oxoacyl-[acyl-carrier protein] reductase
VRLVFPAQDLRAQTMEFLQRPRGEFNENNPGPMLRSTDKHLTAPRVVQRTHRRVSFLLDDWLEVCNVLGGAVDLRKKTIAITGAGRGIGQAMATHFARRGANIALIDLNAQDLEETQSACVAFDVTARSYVANVAVESEVEAVFNDIVADFDRLDGLVNNAGILRDALLVKVKDGEVVGKMSLAQWQAVVDVNLTGVFLCGREAASHMIQLGNGGVIVNISSISRAGNSGQTNYSAAKAGVAAMSVVWAKELARHGVRVAAIAPGFTRTTLLDNMKPEMLEKMLQPVPLKRLGTAEEIADAATFIFQNEFFTGRCIDLDGGLRL